MAQNTNLVRAEGLWYERPGTVVFQAESTIYRLFPDILADCSPFFRDMFEVPQPNTSETYEGMPLAKMPDSAADVTPFFQAIFRPGFSPICLPETDDVSIELVTAILRLSTKYNVEYLRYHALRHLRSRIPTSPSDYHNRGQMWMPEEALSLIPLLRKCNALWLLPMAYYLSASPSCHHGENGFLDFMESHASQAGIELSEERRIWNGRARIALDGNGIATNWLTENPFCAVEDCASVKGVWASAIVDSDPFSNPPWDNIFDPDAAEPCVPCFRAMQSEHKKGVREIWDTLPSYFGLPAWDVLSKMEATEMDFGYRLTGGAAMDETGEEGI